MNLFKFYLKTALLFIVTVTLAPFYFFMLSIFYPWRQILGPELVRFYSKICLFIFRVKIDNVKNYRIFGKRKRGFLIISNHASFLDIFALSGLFGSVFVSKAEVKSYPIIGQIAWLMGVIFIDRDSSRERLKILKTIAKKYSGRILAVFPQGTTGLSSDRLPFNRGIFKVIELNPDITLLPVTLHYKEDTEIAWHNPQSLKENALKVFGQKRIRLKVIIHDPVTIDDYRGKTAEQICKKVERTVLGPLEKGY
jgi:1-acyl-sn-glycerol-3-phosphate acyltransferase